VRGVSPPVLVVHTAPFGLFGKCASGGVVPGRTGGVEWFVFPGLCASNVCDWDGRPGRVARFEESGL